MTATTTLSKLHFRSGVARLAAVAALLAIPLVAGAGCGGGPQSCSSGFLLAGGTDGVLCMEQAPDGTFTEEEFGNECTARNADNMVSSSLCNKDGRIGRCDGIPAMTTDDGKVFSTIVYYYGTGGATADDARAHCESFHAKFTPL
jgi:hypothetical protein